MDWSPTMVEPVTEIQAAGFVVTMAMCLLALFELNATIFCLMARER
jgi:hypothetical protein